MKTTKSRQFGWVWFFVMTVMVTAAQADWTYSDNFTGKKAEKDSYAHSRFWSGDMTPLPEPYLYYQDSSLGGGLVFVGYEEQDAELGYCFPIGSTFANGDAKGTLAIDIAFPSNSRISQWVPGRLSYKTSPDGMAWSEPVSLTNGYHEIALVAPSGTAYVMFSGTRAVIMGLSVGLDSSSTTIYVSPFSGTIQAAIDSAQDGDVIEVAAGTYSGPGNCDIELRGKRITVRSAAGPENTIIDCGLSGVGHRGFYFHEAEGADTVVSGFTVRGGRILGTEVPSNPLYWTPSASHPIGGGIFCEFSSPTIANCIIEDCEAEYGGGIGIVGGEPTISSSVVTGCSDAGYGAGIAIIAQSNATIASCVISGNTADNNSQGGGIYCYESSAVIAGTEISGNTASGTLAGGGLYCGGDGANVLVKNSVIYNNVAASGAGLYAEWSGGSASQRSQINVVNCTIAQNELSGSTYSRAGGIQSSNADIVVNSSIIWDNEATEIVLNNPLSINPVTYSNVQGGYSGTGNINSDPQFVSAVSGDFHLKSNVGRYLTGSGQWVYDSSRSPCIDAGDPSISACAEPGPNGERINMGAFGQTEQASKGWEYVIYHVDGTGGRDWYDGRSRSSAFATIGKAVDAANTGDTILVWPGTYYEDVRYRNKGLTIQSAADAATIIAETAYAFSFYSNEGTSNVLSNFVIRNCPQGAIFCDEGASPTLKNLTIVGNRFGIRIGYSTADPYITNCILWGNADGDLSEEFKAHYSCIQHAEVDKYGGNINSNPLFADPDNHDYHLKSAYGRYDPQTGTWVTDVTTSPCINAGDPGDIGDPIYPRVEPTPNGNRTNIGAYGETPYASLWNFPDY